MGTSPRTAQATQAAEDARRQAERGVRLVLEVLDLRRSPRQLKPFVSDRMIDVVQVHARTAADKGSGTATLRRLRVRLQNNTSAEVFGTYSRGDRVFAFAARMERGRVHAGSTPAWTITQIQLV